MRLIEGLVVKYDNSLGNCYSVQPARVTRAVTSRRLCRECGVITFMSPQSLSILGLCGNKNAKSPSKNRGDSSQRCNLKNIKSYFIISTHILFLND